eukprot:99665_1
MRENTEVWSEWVKTALDLQHDPFESDTEFCDGISDNTLEILYTGTTDHHDRTERILVDKKEFFDFIDAGSSKNIIDQYSMEYALEYCTSTPSKSSEDELMFVLKYLFIWMVLIPYQQLILVL